MSTSGRWPNSLVPGDPANHELDTRVSRALGYYDPPAFPTTVATALAKVRDPEIPLREVARTLSFDPRLTIKLLSVLNSPAYAFRSPVLSVEHAVALLGRDQLEAMLLSMGVRGSLPSQGGRHMNRTRFWQAAARRATLARTLALELEEKNAAASFTASLLQDMAVPVLSAKAGEHYDEMLAEWGAGQDLAMMEDTEYGWNHADVAGWLCERWRFPEALIGAIGAHHRAHRSYSSVPPPPVTMVACLREGDGDFGQDEFIENASQRTGIGRDRLKELVDRSHDEANEIAQAYL